MAEQQPDLERIQRWMQAVIMHPGEISEGVQSDEARRQLELPPDQLEKVITRSQALTAEERLAIYHNAYYARLLECLREEFPVLVHALSEEVFDAFAFGYLQQYPSRSYTLIHLGEQFPHYLEETRPEADEDMEASGWPEFLIDLATLELTFNQVFDGPGVEEEQPLEAEQLLDIPAERWPEARLVPVPCLRLLTLRYPVHQYYTAVRRGEDPAPPEPADTFLAVTRRDYVVRHLELTRTAYQILEAFTTGSTVGETLLSAAEEAGPDLDRLATQLRAWFRTWAAEGLFRAVSVSE